MLCETYRGVKLKVRALRGRDYGRTRYTVNGNEWGDWLGRDEEYALETCKRTVDEAGKRPDAYPDYWHPTNASNGARR